MSKEYLEALENLKQQAIAFEHGELAIKVANGNYTTLKEALQRLEAIDNANPSEALECLEEMYEVSCDSRKPEYNLYETIKQALLKAQEQDFNYKNIVIPFFDELVKLLGINDTDEMLDKIKEQEKVLEIIKEKRVDEQLIRIADNVEWYNKNYIYRHEIEYLNRDDVLAYQLTAEEFDTLKRWLGCVKN